MTFSSSGRQGNDDHDLIAPWPEEPQASEPTAPAVGASVDPGEGYRLLEIGEVIKPNDEFLDPEGDWQKTYDSGLTHVEKHMSRRRRIPNPAAEVTRHATTEEIQSQRMGMLNYKGGERQTIAAPAVDVWSHEREQYRRAIDTLTAERDELSYQVHQLTLSRNDVAAERDKLKAELDEWITEEKAACEYAVSILPKEIADAMPWCLESAIGNLAAHVNRLNSELAAIKSEPKAEQWRNAGERDINSNRGVYVSNGEVWWCGPFTLLAILGRNQASPYVVEAIDGVSSTSWKQARVRMND